MAPRISVIIPVWNRQDLIEKCLNSVLKQSVRPFELIVVDNKSADDTFLRVKKWMELHADSGINFKLLSQQKKGACPTRQKGLENATGEYVFFFDSDDQMLPSLLENAVSKIEENPSVDIVCWKCRINLLDGTLKVPPVIMDKPLESHLIHTLLRPQGYLVKREFLLNAGGWSKQIKVWNDFELGLRLLLKNPEIIFINQILAEIYSQEESITGKDFSSKEGEWETTIDEMEKMADSSRHPQSDKIIKILNYRRAILAAHYYREHNYKGAENLVNKAFQNSSVMERFLLKFSYHFTRKGLRGVWRIVGNFY